jgi:hypothetical protein
MQGPPPGTPWQPAQPWPQWGPGPQVGQPPPPGYGGFPPPPRRNRKPLLIGLSVGGALLVVILIVVLVAVINSGGGASNGGDAVKGYLEALARGDAKAALSYSNDQPASKDLLTDEVLKKQIAQWPITNIQILDDNSAHSFGFGQVHVSAKFGDNTSDVTLSVRKTGKSWLLEHSAIKLDTTSSGIGDEAMKTVTFFGKPISGQPAYVFPGWVDASSSNSNLGVKVKKPFLLDSLSTSGIGFISGLDISLSDSGVSATMSAITAALRDCTRSNLLAPPDCPQHAFDSSIVDGTVTWGTPDTSGVKISFFDPYRLQANFSGETVFPLTATAKAGGTKIGTVKTFLSGKSDVSHDPPTVSLR